MYLISSKQFKIRDGNAILDLVKENGGRLDRVVMLQEPHSQKANLGLIVDVSDEIAAILELPAWI